jgi:hypothetical protein
MNIPSTNNSTISMSSIAMAAIQLNYPITALHTTLYWTIMQQELHLDDGGGQSVNIPEFERVTGVTIVNKWSMPRV